MWAECGCGALEWAGEGIGPFEIPLRLPSLVDKRRATMATQYMGLAKLTLITRIRPAGDKLQLRVTCLRKCSANFKYFAASDALPLYAAVCRYGAISVLVATRT